MTKEQKIGVAIGILGVLVAILTLLREVFDFRMSLPAAAPTTMALPTKVSEALETNTPVPPTLQPVLDSCGAFVDLGNAQSEAGHNLAGWGGAWSNQPPSPSGDTTFQYQNIGGEASLKLCLPEANADYLLVTEAQDFGCDDSFQIYINNNSEPALSFKGTKGNVVRVHSITIRSDEVIPAITVKFRNLSTDCGAAAVYNVALKRK